MLDEITNAAEEQLKDAWGQERLDTITTYIKENLAYVHQGIHRRYDLQLFFPNEYYSWEISKQGALNQAKDHLSLLTQCLHPYEIDWKMEVSFGGVDLKMCLDIYKPRK